MTRNRPKPKPEPEDTKPSAFDSLADALQGQFDAPLQDLPDGLRERVERAFPPVSWAMLSAEQRRHRAREWDREHDPAGEEERQRGFDSAEREADIERRMRQLELMNPQTPRELESKNQQMDELRRELTDVEALPPEGDACAVFRALRPPLIADDVSITFVAGSEGGLLLEITARGNTRRLPPALLDLVNRTDGSLNAQGGALLALASGKRLLHSPNNAQIVSRLRKALKHLGIARGAFEAYRPVYGWVPRFNVHDKRNAADERAAREAERKTVSYDGLRERGRQFEVGEDWLKKHDTDEQE